MIKKKYIHKGTQVLLAVFATLFLLTPSIAKADVIDEPTDDFVNTHMEECEYSRRTYEVNGPDGNATVYASPVNPRKVGSFKNGEQIELQWIYKDEEGVEWGYNPDKEGWIPMAYAPVVYDAISFLEEYSAEIEEVPDDELMELKTDKAYFWDYPGAKEPRELAQTTGSEFGFRNTYRDANGKLWGYVAYWCGNQDFWVCIDEPDSLEASAQITDPKPVSSESVKMDGEIVPKGAYVPSKAFVVIGACILFAVVATVIILIRSKKRIENR